MASSHKFGRRTRGCDPRIPHMSALLAGKTLKPPPAAKDFTKGMPADLGAMLNDQINDCSCAAYYHALQVWTFNTTGKIRTEPDSNVELLYRLACGYDPRVKGIGPVADEQAVLTYLLRNGAPIGPKGKGRRKIAGFIEVDPRQIDDVKRAIAECGIVYVGLHMPQYLAPPAFPAAVWDVRKAGGKVVGDHAVILAGYNAKGTRVISWGQYFTMTWDFFTKFVDEVYAVVDAAWVRHKGTVPGGLTLSALRTQMKALNG